MATLWKTPILSASSSSDCSACLSGSPLENRAVVQAVKFGSYGQSPFNIARFCSAVAEAQFASSFELVFDNEYQDTTPSIATWLWKWVAYAFFSPHAERSSITSVGLRNVSITEVDAEAVAEILSSSDPLSLLSSHLEVDQCPCIAGMLRVGTIISVLPMQEDEPNYYSLSWVMETDIYGQVLANIPGDTSEVCMLFPGYGLCTAPRAAFIPDTETARPAQEVTSLKVEFERHPAASAGLGRLLVLIGASLTHLRIDLHFGVDLWVPTILRCCPNLTSLFVGEGVINGSVFASAHKESGLRLEELYCFMDNLGPFVATLASCAGSRLKRFACRVQCPDSEDSDSEDTTLEDVAEMLRTNSTLEFLCLSLPDDVCYPDGLSEVLNFHGQLLHATPEAFPLRCRLAFLSVVFTASHSSKRSRKRRAPTALPTVLSRFPIARHVFQRIFELAATNVPRHVYVYFFEP